MPKLEKTAKEELLEDVRGYGLHWSNKVTLEDIEEDEAFLYLEIESEADIRDDFMEMGRYLGARSTVAVNDGERYVLSIEK